MPKTTIITGLLLCSLTVMILLITGGVNSISIFIPTFVGVPLALCGAIAAAKPQLRKHVMHVAVLVGLLGALAALGRGVPQLIKLAKGEEVSILPVTMVWGMAVICIVYVILCVKSFIDARRNRTESPS